MIRTFIAAKVASTRALCELCDCLQELDKRLHPVSPNDLHVTLKFLGETSESQVEPIGAVMRRVVESRPAIQVSLSGLRAFPHAGRPSVVWVGLEPGEPLRQIAAELDHELSSLGFEPEHRPFTAHLTLLRVKTRPPEALLAMLAEESQTDFGLVEFSRVQLFQSDLTRSGSRYTQLATAVLGEMGSKS